MADNRFSQSNVLIIRHLPASLCAHEKEDFIKYFGAVSVKCMADKGRMKHTAFATFKDESAAERALHRLHQLDVLGHTLTVEFAKQRRHVPISMPSIDSKFEQEDNINGKSSKSSEASELHRKDGVPKKNFGNSNGLNMHLKYSYPPPTVSILSNIVNALASVPKFYVQTLHLMNKMSLPAPFGPQTPAPPLEDDEIELPPEPDEIYPAEMEVTSSSEGSEMESDEEGRERAKVHDQQMGHATVKRSREEKHALGSVSKRARRRDKITPPAPKAVGGYRSVPPPGGGSVPWEAVFDPALVSKGKKAEIRLAQSITSSLERQMQHGQAEGMPSNMENNPGDIATAVTEVGGFGTFQPARMPAEVPSGDVEEEDEEEEEEEEDDGPESAEFITREQLKKKLSKEEIKHISVFKNYSPGDPTTRLYIKNLGKQVEEKDLKFIYGRYVDWASPMDRDMFNIQLMKQGRMKGQAFVGLPSELAAQKALRDTNGFLLHDKPIVVSFARSAKPKDKEDDPKKKRRDAGNKKRDADKRQMEARRI